MKQIDQAYLRKARWFGAKPLIARIARARVINVPLTAVARKWLPTQVRQRLPIAADQVSYRLSDGSSIVMADAFRDLVARDLFWGGGAPKEPAERYKLACFEGLSRMSRTVVDIGAYSGICALVAARANPNASVIAYEIVPENFFLLQRNIVGNDFIGQIDARLRGLGSSPGTMTVPQSLHLPSLETSVSLGSSFEEGVQVPVSTLDLDMTSANGPMLIKIDVEGFEPDVLEGGTAILRKHRPDIICEILPSTGTAERIAALLRPLGYDFFEFTEQGMKPRTEIAPRAVMRDWLFTVKQIRDLRETIK